MLSKLRKIMTSLTLMIDKVNWQSCDKNLKVKKSDFSNTYETWDRIRMRISIILMPIRIRIRIGINIEFWPRSGSESKRCRSTTLILSMKKLSSHVTVPHPCAGQTLSSRTVCRICWRLLVTSHIVLVDSCREPGKKYRLNLSINSLQEHFF
jgi:hypothetical protein